jgi:hypothetical protein
LRHLHQFVHLNTDVCIHSHVLACTTG